MSLLNGYEIQKLLDQGVVTNRDGSKINTIVDINAASLDIHLGQNYYVESMDSNICDIFKGGVQPNYAMGRMTEDKPLILQPGEFVLAESVEVFNLPSDVSCRFILKSTAARNGLDQADAGWCDAGWNGSVLTLELRNNFRRHRIRLIPGTKIGQLVFFRHGDSGAFSYAGKGSYNGDKSVSRGK